MMLWRPRSLLQLTLIGFFLAVAPLCVAIFYTVQAFDRLAVNNSQVATRLVELTRANQVLQADLWALERSAGQYVALSDPQLLALFKREHEKVSLQLEQLEPLLDKERGFYLLPLKEAMEHLRVAMLAPADLFNGPAVLQQFDPISEQALELRRASQDYVDQQLQNQVARAQEIKASLVLMVVSLALLTLLAALFFIYWINRPVRQIEQRIGQLGRGDLTQKISISGPQELQLVGERLDWLRTQLHELDEQKQQFLRHVSHELKTPLASLREGTDLLAEGVVGTLDHRQQEIVAIVQQNSRELQRLIENLLDYNQLLHHRRLTIEPVDVHVLWQELLASYAIIIERKGLSISTTGGACKWPVDPSKFRTVLDNLLSNAVNYSPERGRVDIVWTAGSKGFECWVKNSGQAIAPEEHQRIFEPFFQGRNSRSGAIKGSGIGLSVARECVHAHRGSLELMEDSQWPVSFRLQLPESEIQG